jgi:hypothetical protein
VWIEEGAISSAGARARLVEVLGVQDDNKASRCAHSKPHWAVPGARLRADGARMSGLLIASSTVLWFLL